MAHRDWAWWLAEALKAFWRRVLRPYLEAQQAAIDWLTDDAGPRLRALLSDTGSSDETDVQPPYAVARNQMAHEGIGIVCTLSLVVLGVAPLWSALAVLIGWGVVWEARQYFRAARGRNVRRRWGWFADGSAFGLGAGAAAWYAGRMAPLPDPWPLFDAIRALPGVLGWIAALSALPVAWGVIFGRLTPSARAAQPQVKWTRTQ